MKIFHIWIILGVYSFYENEAAPTTASPSSASTTVATKDAKELKKIKRGIVSVSQLQHQPGGHFHYYPFAHHQHASIAPAYSQGYTVSQIRTYEPTTNIMKSAADNGQESQSQYYINNNAPISPSTPNTLSTNEQPTITPYFAMPSIVNSDVSAVYHPYHHHHHHLSQPHGQPVHSEATYQHQNIHYGHPNYVSQQSEFIPAPRGGGSVSAQAIQTHPSPVYFSGGNSQQTLFNKYNPQASNLGSKVHGYNTYPLNVVTPQTFIPSHKNYHAQPNKLYHYNNPNNGQYHNQISSTTASPLRYTTIHNRKNTEGTVTTYPVTSYVKKPTHSQASYKKHQPTENKSKVEDVQEIKDDYEDERNDSEDEDDDDVAPPSSSKYRTIYKTPSKYTSYKTTYYDDNDESEYRPQRYHRYHDDDDDERHSNDDDDNERVEADTKIVKHKKKYSKRNEHSNNNKEKKLVAVEKPVYEKVKVKSKVSTSGKPKKKTEVIEGKYSNQVPVTIGHKTKKQYQANWYYSSVKNED